MSPARRALFRTNPLPTSRVEAFSDGVLAVVITLLVLDIKVPAHLGDDAAVWRAVEHLLPALLSWAISFTFVLTFWVSHHDFFATLEHTDRGLLWLNGLFLLASALIPFPTGLVAEYPQMTAPYVLLSSAMLFTSLAFTTMRIYATFHGKLLREGVEGREARRSLARSTIAPLLYASATALAFLWTPVTIAIQILVLILFVFRRSTVWDVV